MSDHDIALWTFIITAIGVVVGLDQRSKNVQGYTEGEGQDVAAQRNGHGYIGTTFRPNETSVHLEKMVLASS